MPALQRLTAHFYERVRVDPVLATVFVRMRGGHPHVITQHLNRHLTQEQRRRWLELLLASADATGLPDDPESCSALVAYLE